MREIRIMLRTNNEVDAVSDLRSNKGHCETCLWNDDCSGERTCFYFTPIEDWSSLSVDVMIEAERVEFNREWNGYINCN